MGWAYGENTKDGAIHGNLLKLTVKHTPNFVVNLEFYASKCYVRKVGVFTLCFPI
jgi:hypothetical protein